MYYLESDYYKNWEKNHENEICHCDDCTKDDSLFCYCNECEIYPCSGRNRCDEKE